MQTQSPTRSLVVDAVVDFIGASREVDGNDAEFFFRAGWPRALLFSLFLVRAIVAVSAAVDEGLTSCPFL